MRIWKYVDGHVEPVMVDLDEVPDDGRHFRDIERAWETIEANIVAGLRLATSAVVSSKRDLAKAEEAVVEAALEFRRFTDRWSAANDGRSWPGRTRS